MGFLIPRAEDSVRIRADRGFMVEAEIQPPRRQAPSQILPYVPDG